MNQSAPVKKSSALKIILIILGALFALCVICIGGTMVADKMGFIPTLSPTPLPSTTALPSATLPPTATLSPSATPPPTATLEPQSALRIEIERVLGTGNRNIPRLTALNFNDPETNAIFVNWAINDNLTENLIIYGAKSDATDILKAIAQSGVDYTYVILSGSFSMVDKFGNTSESNVVNLTFYKTTVDKINWDNFLSDNIYTIADQAAVWVAFQDK